MYRGGNLPSGWIYAGLDALGMTIGDIALVAAGGDGGPIDAYATLARQTAGCDALCGRKTRIAADPR